MAYADALFQLGMDLTRSSTAQEEDHGLTAHVARDTVEMQPHHDSTSSFIVCDGVRYAGNHLIIDLFGAKRLDDVAYVEQTLRRCAAAIGREPVSVHLHGSAPDGGVSGVATAAGGHISFHSWPEAGYAAFDVFMTGSAKPQVVIDLLQDAFAARDVVVKEHRRGEAFDRLARQATVRRPALAPVVAVKAKSPMRNRTRKAA